jgi:cytochrome c553
MLMKQIIKRFVVTVFVLLIIVVAGVGAFIYCGIYDMGADDPHTRPVFSLLQTLRDRSIAAHSKDLQVPDLADATRVLKGAGQYAAMCTQCHLAPGTKESEIRPGLYPAAAQSGPVAIRS